jgi:hypothetical protein
MYETSNSEYLVGSYLNSEIAAIATASLTRNIELVICNDSVDSAGNTVVEFYYGFVDVLW